jgi:hypothetical protein
VAFWFALAAAAAFAVATVLQHGATDAVPEHHALRLRLLGFMLRSRKWWAGRIVEFVALGLQTLALAHGSLMVVQPVLATGLLMALPLNALTAKRRLGRLELAGALVVTVGLALFLLVGQPKEGDAGGHWGRWAVGLTLVAVICALLVSAGWRAGPGGRATLWATAAGVVYAASGALLKATTDVIGSQGFGGALLHPALYGFLVVGALGTLLVQSAFHAAPLPASIAALTAAEPMAGGLVGFVVFGDSLRGGPLPVTVEILTALLLVMGTMLVARSPLLAEDQQARRQPARSGPREPFRSAG